MSINLNNLDRFVRRETLKTVKEVLGTHLTEDDDERRRQEKLATVVKKRNLNAEDKSKTADDVDEAEADNEEDTEETQSSGVPRPEDEKPRDDRTGGKGTADSPKLATPSGQQIDKATAQSLVDKLNALRGGKSLKDPAVRKSFDQYLKGLAKQERESLFIFLTALAQILAGVVSGGEAIDPGDVGLRVKKGETSPTKKEKVTVKVKEKEKPQGAGTEEAPIIVGEQQQKGHIRKILEAYKSLS